MEIPRLLEQAQQQMTAITGLRPVTITQVFRDDEGWHVGVEMLEMSRIPSATDVLGEYDLLLGEGGDLLRFERRRTRLRGEARGTDNA